jgi:asparagine synthase (glutamine-hydrolysing)
MFICALNPKSEPMRGEQLLGYLDRSAVEVVGPVEAMVAGPFAALVAATGTARRPGLARSRYLIAVGSVRLDNRGELRRMVEADSSLNDLELLVRVWQVHGEACVPWLTGDFAFVIWDARAHKLVAVRDAFGVRSLFWARDAGSLAFSSHATPLRRSDRYDLDYIADFIAGQPPASGRTVWADVQIVTAGSYVVHRGTIGRTLRYWDVEEHPPRAGSTTAGDVEAFRALLVEAVKRQMDAPQATWAHLSGGLDSSSIVAIAASEGSGLGGTLTVVDTLGAGDERAYSDAVARRFGIRNEQVVDYWAWQDDGCAPQRLDQPWPLYPFYARDRRMRSVVRNGGARVLLSGTGADHYLAGNLGYIPDLLATKQARRAVRDLAAWAATSRGSFWSLARRLLVQRSPVRGSAAASVPAWLTRELLAGTELRERLQALQRPLPAGNAFAAGIVRELRALPGWLERYGYGGDIDVRHPFLYRPLVELALRLPADARIRPGRTKWILREAMRGLLPDEVRGRSSKGSIDARVLWSFGRERTRVDALLSRPRLADLGVIDVETLRNAVERARQGICPNPVQLMSTLSLEMWLAVQEGSFATAAASASHAA